eukprot:3929422-Pleurochrysis_carterae.AAC.2
MLSVAHFDSVPKAMLALWQARQSLLPNARCARTLHCDLASLRAPFLYSAFAVEACVVAHIEMLRLAFT